MGNAVGQNRLDDVKELYRLIDILQARQGPVRPLSELAKRDLPLTGVYFFFEPGETRSESGEGPRIVRVGTHGLHAGSTSTLYGRLVHHRGPKRTGRGNHRTSVMRRLIGHALISASGPSLPTWGDKKCLRDQRSPREAEIEQMVSMVIGGMPVICLGVGTYADRALIEKNAIALLSNYLKAEIIDPPSPTWMGRHCGSKVEGSGLWNQNHVAQPYERSFLGRLAQIIETQNPRNEAP